MKISVIIPVYSVEEFLPRCLDSVVNQSLRDIEIIVVNDASPDASDKIVEAYAARDSRVRMIHHEHNRGLMMARATGCQHSLGDYITFVDSDDYLPLDALEKMYELALKQGADLVCGSMDRLGVVGIAGKIAPGILSSSLPFGCDAESMYRSLLKGKLRHELCGKLFKKKLFEPDYVRYENMIFCEDEFLFFQMAKHVNKAVVLNDIVYHYCCNQKSSTRKELPLWQIECSIISNQLIDGLRHTYPSLRCDVVARVAGSLIGRLIRSGNLRYKKYNELLSKYGMQRYLSPGFVWRHTDWNARFRLCASIMKSILVRLLK